MAAKWFQKAMTASMASTYFLAYLSPLVKRHRVHLVITGYDVNASVNAYGVAGIAPFQVTAVLDDVSWQSQRKLPQTLAQV